MGCRSVTSAFMFLFALSAGTAQVNSTQPAPAISTGTNQMDSPSLKRSVTVPETDIDVAYLETHVDQVMDNAITSRDIPGGVVLVLRNGNIVLNKAYGNRAVSPTTETATLDTIYDLASLTKSVATATSIMILVEQGKIRLNDNIKKFLPEWKNSEEEAAQAKLLEQLEKGINSGKVKTSQGRWETADQETADVLAKALTAFPDLESPTKIGEQFTLLPRDRESITIKHLLTHTSGLASFVRYYEKFPEGSARKKIVADIAQSKLRGPVGGQFIYSDLGFIVLGDIVERVSGEPLDKFSHKHIFEPLEMDDTMYSPPDDLTGRIAPTEWRASQDTSDNEATRTQIRGDVHDGNAWVQDGVSGHAGLFSTAADLGIFCQMLLDGGAGRGNRILSPVTIEAMTRDHARLPDAEPQRALGWDLTSSYASPKGDLFSSGFGHTGFTGTSIWVVPEEKLAIIILCNRVHPDGKGDTTPLRARIANIVAASITKSNKHQTSEK